MSLSKINIIAQSCREARMVVRDLDLDCCAMFYHQEYDVLEGEWLLRDGRQNYVNLQSDTFWLVEEPTFDHALDHIRWMCNHCHVEHATLYCDTAHCERGVHSKTQGNRCAISSLAINLSVWVDSGDTDDSGWLITKYRPNTLMLVVGNPGNLECHNEVQFGPPSCNPKAMKAYMLECAAARNEVCRLLDNQLNWISLAEDFVSRFRGLKQIRDAQRHELVDCR